VGSSHDESGMLSPCKRWCLSLDFSDQTPVPLPMLSQFLSFFRHWPPGERHVHLGPVVGIPVSCEA
jgi:hypothetical protein